MLHATEALHDFCVTCNISRSGLSLGGCQTLDQHSIVYHDGRLNDGDACSIQHLSYLLTS